MCRLHVPTGAGGIFRNQRFLLLPALGAEEMQEAHSLILRAGGSVLPAGVTQAVDFTVCPLVCTL
jgi:hypothetical protein